MKKNLFIMIAVSAAVIFAGCSKDEEGSDGQFRVHVPSFVKGTTPIRVDLSVACDTAPTVTFTTEGDALGVVSLTETPDFDTEYVYAGEPIEVRFVDGTASASFWYFPLTVGDHGVSFSVSFTQNGIDKTTTSRRVLSVSDAANGGFYPEVYCADPGRYFFVFRNVLEKKGQGCDFRIAFESLNDKTDLTPDYLTVSQETGRVTMEENVFYSIETAMWDGRFEDWMGGDALLVWILDEADNDYYTKTSKSIVLKVICRDDYNRCRDVVIITDTQGNVVSSEASEYYLWRNRK